MCEEWGLRVNKCLPGIISFEILGMMTENVMEIGARTVGNLCFG